MAHRPRPSLRHSGRIARLSLLVLLGGCQPPTAPHPPLDPPLAVEPATQTTDIDELVAFAKLYGTVRYFYPGDAAARIDWPAFVVQSLDQVTAARDDRELARILTEQLASIAPDSTIAIDGSFDPDPPQDHHRSAPGEIAWQHLGYGPGASQGTYHSKRTQRTHEEAEPGREASAVVTTLDAKPLRGRRIRFEAAIELAPRRVSDHVEIVMLARREAAESPNTEIAKASAHPREWAVESIEGTVPADADELWLGFVARGVGRYRFDDAALHVWREDGDWELRPLADPSFDDAAPSGAWVQRVGTYEVGTTRHAPRSGSGSLQIQPKTITLADELFAERPYRGERSHVRLSPTLVAHVPLSLTAAEASTPPPATARVGAVGHDLFDQRDPHVRTAAVIEAWNVFRHFHPMDAELDLDWDAVLRRGLIEARRPASEVPLEHVLRHLGHELHDGHFTAQDPTSPWGWAPARFIRDGERIVTFAASPTSGLQPGDEIVVVDEIPVQQAVTRHGRLSSGAAHLLEHLVLAEGLLTRGALGTTVALRITRDGRPIALDVTRTQERVAWPFRREAMQREPDGVWYVDLRAVSWAQLQAELPALATAPGVVFDLRGTPLYGNHEIIRHLLRDADRAQWMFEPKLIRPRPAAPEGWIGSGWDLEPASPHIAGNVAFLINPATMSYAESIVGFVEHHRLGALVGRPTAGAYGIIVTFPVPGAIHLMFTGMRVTKLDGTPHYAVGFQPTHAVTPTLAPLLRGEDEALARASALVRAPSSPR